MTLYGKSWTTLFLCCIHSHLYSRIIKYFICNYKQYPGLRRSPSLCERECDRPSTWSDSCHPFRMLLTPAQWIIFNPHKGLGSKVCMWVCNFLLLWKLTQANRLFYQNLHSSLQFLYQIFWSNSEFIHMCLSSFLY